MNQRGFGVGLLAVCTLFACSKDDQTNLVAKVVDAAPPPAGPTSLDLAKPALVTAKAKYAKHEAVEADCAPLKSLAADFAKDKSPDAVKTTREINAFCAIDVALEGAVATLKADQEKLTAALKKKDRTTEQMYTATVKDGCASIKLQLDGLVGDHLDGEPKVATLKAQIDPICSPPSDARKK
jgi:hypothetical protein